MAISDNTLWVYNKEWSDSSDDMAVPKEKFAVYSNGQFDGAYYLQFNNRWFLYDENDNVVKHNGEFLAYNGNKRLDVVNVNYETFDELDYRNVEQALTKLNLPKYNELSISNKIEYDLNHDKVIEKVYTISNVYSDKESKYYSLLFISSNNGIEVIDSSVNDEESRYLTYTYEFKYLIDIQKNKNYEIIVMKDLFGNPLATCYSMYEYKKTFNKLIGC